MQITYKREDFEILQGIPVDVVRFSDLGTSQGCIYEIVSKDGNVHAWLHFHFSPSQSSHGKHCNLECRGQVGDYGLFLWFYPLWGEYDIIFSANDFIDSIIKQLSIGITAVAVIWNKEKGRY